MSTQSIIPGMPTLPTQSWEVLVRETEGNARFTTQWYDFFRGGNNVIGALLKNMPINVGWAARLGGANDAGVVQDAINQTITRGGGIVLLPAGEISMTGVSIPRGAPPIALVGQGMFATTIKGLGKNANGIGIIDAQSDDFWLCDLSIDAGVTQSTGLKYGRDFNGVGGNDPSAPSLTQGTSVWVHGPCKRPSFRRVRFTHAAGYSALIDCIMGDIEDASFIDCLVENNRPTTFGTVDGQLIYGSWNGGIYINGDGRSPTAGVLKGLLVAMCRFRSNTGNTCWAHSYGLNRLHSDFRIVGNSFLDCGLDGVLVGAVSGGVVDGNTFRRVGYIVAADGAKPVPRWLANLQATALDSSGLVLNVPYLNNSFLNINGGCADLDSHGSSVVGSNVMRVSDPADAEYLEDSVAISGPLGTGAESYGVNLGNSSNLTQGARRVQISSNLFENLAAGSVRLFGARDCHVIANDIIAPVGSVSPPISLGPVGPGPNQRATGNVIKHNRVSYSPGSPNTPVVFEDPTEAPFVNTDVNHVLGNGPIFGNGNAKEFVKDVNSGSPTYLETPWFT